MWLAWEFGKSNKYIYLYTMSWRFVSPEPPSGRMDLTAFHLRQLAPNVGLKGKNKLADKWEKEVYLVVEQPNNQIPVYVVKREHGRGATKMLHRNLLLPFMALPLSKPGVDSTVEPSNSSQPSPIDVETVGYNLGSKQGSRDAVY